MADGNLSIRIVFKAGAAQLKNPEEEYEITTKEFERLFDEMRAISVNGGQLNVMGSYAVSRFSTALNREIQTRLVLRFADVLYIG